MNNQELYNKVIEAYKAGDDNAFVAAARNWIENTEESPFNDSELNSLFGSAKRNYRLWKSNGISSRVSKLRMVSDVRKIMEKGTEKTPEEPVKEDMVLDKPKYIFGVIPMETLHIEEDKPEVKKVRSRKPFRSKRGDKK